MKKKWWIVIGIVLISLLILRFIFPYITTYVVMRECFKYALLMESPNSENNFINKI